jgi:hypothetical protein
MKTPEAASPGVFLLALVVAISVKPFADVVAYYPCSDRNNKRDYVLQSLHPLSVARLGATT